ncbi:PH domain-containing protein [Paenibacillus taiwanensis]|uniref:PH domain-containing protein n=1 Tax=Paenibacillus taiwanensis TaxID=401638 RepID=UPI000490F698|nr:PH domain-containing protein [Paenibacillus taiwanensis]
MIADITLTQFQEHLRPNESLIKLFPCTLAHTTVHPGMLAITNDRLLYLGRSSLTKKTYTVIDQYPFEHITYVTVNRIPFYARLMFTCRDESYIFYQFLNGDIQELADLIKSKIR